MGKKIKEKKKRNQSLISKGSLQQTKAKPAYKKKVASLLLSEKVVTPLAFCPSRTLTQE